MVEREPEFDMFHYELAAALTVYEGSLNELGFPRDEAMSIDANTDNSKWKYRYEGREVGRDFSVQALEDAKAEVAKTRPDGKIPDSMRFTVEKIER